MKKTLILLLTVAVIGGALQAQGLQGGLNLGIMTDDSLGFDPLIWSVGLELGIPLGSFLVFSPECLLYGYKFEFKQFLLFPGAILNINLSQLFLGGGVVKGFTIGEGVSASTDLALKLNAGFQSYSFKLTAYLITPFDALLEKGMIVGATLGFRF